MEWGKIANFAHVVPCMAIFRHSCPVEPWPVPMLEATARHPSGCNPMKTAAAPRSTDAPAVPPARNAPPSARQE